MYQPPMPPDKPNALVAATANFKRMPLVVRVLVIVFVVIVVCGCIGIVASASQPKENVASTTATSAPISNATQPKATNTVPKATATPAGPQLLTGATLGGLQAAFQAKYGTPTGTGAAKTYHFDQGVVTATTSSDASSDGKTHISSLRVGPASGSWDAATALPICQQFLPPDAVFGQEQTVAGYGNERVYTSVRLALSVPAGDFNGAPAGTFSIEDGPGWPLNTGCIIVLGQ